MSLHPFPSLPVEMIAIAIPSPGGPEVLHARRMPLPASGPGDVLIQVAACGINAPDMQQRRGLYDPPPGHSSIPGLEVAGEIVAIGDGVTAFTPGQRVIGLCNGGGYAEYAAVPAGQVLPLPDKWSFVEGAALPETWFTVQQTLVMAAHLAPGMVVLIHGAAGGIGGAAITIARHYGARPLAVVSTPDKANYAMELGAEAVIIHTEQDFVARTRELTGGTGADRIISFTGGPILARNIEAAARSATIIQLAGLGDQPSEIDVGRLLGKWLTIFGSTLRPRTPQEKAEIAASLRADLWPALNAGTITPPTIKTFGLGEAEMAHRAMEQRSNYGKIVLITEFGSANSDPQRT